MNRWPRLPSGAHRAFRFSSMLAGDHSMSSVFSVSEELGLGVGWTAPENGCRLSAADLRTVDQDVHVGQLAGGGTCRRNACETGALATR